MNKPLKKRVKKSYIWFVILMAFLFLVGFMSGGRAEGIFSNILSFIGRDQLVLAYPDSANFNPEPSLCHDTWGCELSEMDPVAMGTEAFRKNEARFHMYSFVSVSERQRLAHPTIIYRIKNTTNRFVVSVDGTNEGSDAALLASHTTVGRMPALPPNNIALIRYREGRLSDAAGRATIPWMRGDCRSRLDLHPREVYRYEQGECDYGALLMRLVTEDDATLWQKFCHAGRQCQSELALVNTLGAPAHIEFYSNSMLKKLEIVGEGEEALISIQKRVGFNGDRLDLEIEYR